MNWQQLLSAKRFGMEEYHDDKHHDRTDFQRDYDRLIFSAPFRRLQNKTQVFPLPGSIFVHNRLTHSIEVSCVGRSLGVIVGKELKKKVSKFTGRFRRNKLYHCCRLPCSRSG
jgi:dGTP triphosphohydrolase